VLTSSEGAPMEHGGPTDKEQASARRLP
jgi:hypothetical protein